MTLASDCVPTYSPLFSDDAADITFQSSDGVLFKIYQSDLQTSSAGFAIPDLTVVDAATIHLGEPANVLEILFQFIRPPSESTNCRQPPARSLEPHELFFAVAEAAEKYNVYGAMNTLLTRMDYELVKTRPIEVLNHAYKHDYPDLADRAAKLSLAHSLKDINRGLTHPGLIQKWLAYYGYWRDVVLRVDSILAKSLPKCARAVHAHSDYTRAVNLDVTRAGSFAIPPNSTKKNGVSCSCCSDSSETPMHHASKEAATMAAAIPKFSAIMI